MLQSITECYRVLQCVTEYRVFLAHLLGLIFGLVDGWNNLVTRFLCHVTSYSTCYMYNTVRLSANVRQCIANVIRSIVLMRLIVKFTQKWPETVFVVLSSILAEKTVRVSQLWTGFSRQGSGQFFQTIHTVRMWISWRRDQTKKKEIFHDFCHFVIKRRTLPPL